MDLVLNNLQNLICHKTQITKSNLEIYANFIMIFCLNPRKISGTYSSSCCPSSGLVSYSVKLNKYVEYPKNNLISRKKSPCLVF